MAKPNYSFAKRQRELEKKNKKEEKRKSKAETKGDSEKVAEHNPTEPSSGIGSASGSDA